MTPISVYNETMNLVYWHEQLKKEKALIPKQNLPVQVVSNAWKQMVGGYTFVVVPNVDI